MSKRIFDWTDDRIKALGDAVVEAGKERRKLLEGNLRERRLNVPNRIRVTLGSGSFQQTDQISDVPNVERPGTEQEGSVESDPDDEVGCIVPSSRDGQPSFRVEIKFL